MALVARLFFEITECSQFAGLAHSLASFIEKRKMLVVWLSTFLSTYVDNYCGYSVRMRTPFQTSCFLLSVSSFYLFCLYFLAETDPQLSFIFRLFSIRKTHSAFDIAMGFFFERIPKANYSSLSSSSSSSSSSSKESKRSSTIFSRALILSSSAGTNSSYSPLTTTFMI